MKPWSAALLGGAIGAALGTAGLLAWRAKRLGEVGQAYTEEIAASTAETYMAETYGLTAARIQRIEAYGRIFDLPPAPPTEIAACVREAARYVGTCSR